MTFNLKKFESASFKDRQESVPVPGLSEFFPDKDSAIWVVRGLTHAEISQAAENVTVVRNVEAMVDAISGTAKEKADAIKGMLGVGGDDVPQETKKRLEYLVMGSIDPVITLDIAVKLSSAFPIEFGMLTNKILNLTGQGKIYAQAKQRPSGK